MQVSVDWAKGSDCTAFVFYTKDGEGKVLICNSVVLNNGEVELLQGVFRASDTKELASTDNQHTQLAIAALRGALSRLPVNLGMVDQILVAFEEELQQQASA
jgi:hypothetical protein